MGEDAYLEMAYEDANGSAYDAGEFIYDDHECDDAYEEGACWICGAPMD